METRDLMSLNNKLCSINHSCVMFKCTLEKLKCYRVLSSANQSVDISVPPIKGTMVVRIVYICSIHHHTLHSVPKLWTNYTLCLVVSRVVVCRYHLRTISERIYVSHYLIWFSILRGDLVLVQILTILRIYYCLDQVNTYTRVN